MEFYIYRDPFYYMLVCQLQYFCHSYIVYPDALPQYQKYGRSLVLVGGNLQENNSEVYNTIIEMAGGKGTAKIGIINTASLDPEGGYKYYRDLFLRYGALEANRIPVDINHTTANSDPDVIKLINQQTGFFFGGGEPQRVIDLFVYANGSKTPALLALRRLFEKGAVISGTSAGTECQPSTVTVKTGESWEALRNGAHTTINTSSPNDMVYNDKGGLGFLDHYVVDAHFSFFSTNTRKRGNPEFLLHHMYNNVFQRGRQGRLIRLLMDTKSMPMVGAYRGFGVDENTALVITNAGTDLEKGRVIGQFGVMFIDVSRSMIDMYSNRYPLRGIYLHYLTHGDEIGLKKMDITFSTTKTPMKNNERFSRALTSANIFGDDNNQIEHVPEFNRISASLFNARFDRSSFGDSVESNPRFHLILSRDSQDSEGWIERTKSGQRDNVAYRNLHLEIHELF